MVILNPNNISWLINLKKGSYLTENTGIYILHAWLHRQTSDSQLRKLRTFSQSFSGRQSAKEYNGIMARGHYWNIHRNTNQSESSIRKLDSNVAQVKAQKSPIFNVKTAFLTRKSSFSRQNGIFNGKKGILLGPQRSQWLLQAIQSRACPYSSPQARRRRGHLSSLSMTKSRWLHPSSTTLAGDSPRLKVERSPIVFLVR